MFNKFLFASDCELYDIIEKGDTSEGIVNKIFEDA
jgi:hypothetical protein